MRTREKLREDFSEWYNSILETAEIVDVRYPVKGLYVWGFWGFQIRRFVTDILRELHDSRGHKETLFPLLIPEKEFMKEAEHIKGFEDQVYWVTRGGNDELDVKLVLRPTSETSMYPMFSLWVRSHADLPMKVYQIVSVFRYETKHTRPLIRVREITTFKEAHTVHSSREDAERQVKEAIEIYSEFYRRLGIPCLFLRRPEWDKFPGAEYTIGVDTIFPDGKVLQIGTIHNLGQNFSKTFEIKFETPSGNREYAYQTCYGISERCIASLIGIHGDDRGLLLPPEVAPVQVIIVPIPYKDFGEEEIRRVCSNIKRELSAEGIRAEIDDRDLRPGWKFYYWESRGVPLRIEIGPRDVKEGKVTIFRRDLMKRESVDAENYLKRVRDLLNQEIIENMRKEAEENFISMIRRCSSLEGIKKCVDEDKKVARVNWCGEDTCGLEINECSQGQLLGYSVNEKESGECIVCGVTTEKVAYVGRTY